MHLSNDLGFLRKIACKIYMTAPYLKKNLILTKKLYLKVNVFTRRIFKIRSRSKAYNNFYVSYNIKVNSTYMYISICINNSAILFNSSNKSPYWNIRNTNVISSKNSNLLSQSHIWVFKYILSKNRTYFRILY